MHRRWLTNVKRQRPVPTSHILIVLSRDPERRKGPFLPPFLGWKKQKKNFSYITWENEERKKKKKKKSEPGYLESNANIKEPRWKDFYLKHNFNILIISLLLLLPWHSGQETFFNLTRCNTCLRNTEEYLESKYCAKNNEGDSSKIIYNNEIILFWLLGKQVVHLFKEKAN